MKKSELKSLIKECIKETQIDKTDRSIKGIHDINNKIKTIAKKYGYNI